MRFSLLKKNAKATNSSFEYVFVSNVTASCDSVVVHKLPEVLVSVAITETYVHGNCRDLLVNIRGAVPLLFLRTLRDIGKEFARGEGIIY